MSVHILSTSKNLARPSRYIMLLGVPQPKANMASFGLGSRCCSTPERMCKPAEWTCPGISPIAMWVSPERKARGVYPETLCIPWEQWAVLQQNGVPEASCSYEEALVVSDLFLATRIGLLIDWLIDWLKFFIDTHVQRQVHKCTSGQKDETKKPMGLFPLWSLCSVSMWIGIMCVCTIHSCR